MQTLQNLETHILSLPTEECEKIQKMYHHSLIKFRHKTHTERGEEKYGKKYSPDEQFIIQTMTNQDNTDEEIAKFLKRSVKGIIQQRQKLIVMNDPEASKKLVKKFAPSKPRADFLIPQHTV